VQSLWFSKKLRIPLWRGLVQALIAAVLALLLFFSLALLLV